MAIPSFLGLQTALRGLVAQQAAIDTTGHNIANANTPGYSRERAELDESTSLTLPAFSNVTGAGVQMADQPHPQSVPGHPVPRAKHGHEQRVDLIGDPRAGPERARRALQPRSRQPAVGVLGRVERCRELAAEPRRAPDADRQRHDAREHLQRNRPAAGDGPVAGRAGLFHDHRTERPDPERRQPDRRAERRDQPGAVGGPAAQRPARRARQPARRPLLVRTGLGHGPRQRAAGRQLR